mmetsp:Transcript_36980/g.122561  ORF Transcript_36980/g.122561 Transcript_36980/m.122561 type:complete len:256 (+) Transcript_36980:1027-1794(+)
MSVELGLIVLRLLVVRVEDEAASPLGPLDVQTRADVREANVRRAESLRDVVADWVAERLDGGDESHRPRPADILPGAAREGMTGELEAGVPLAQSRDGLGAVLVVKREPVHVFEGHALVAGHLSREHLHRTGARDCAQRHRRQVEESAGVGDNAQHEVVVYRSVKLERAILLAKEAEEGRELALDCNVVRGSPLLNIPIPMSRVLPELCRQRQKGGHKVLGARLCRIRLHELAQLLNLVNEGGAGRLDSALEDRA